MNRSVRAAAPQRELDKPSQINYTMNRKSADRNMASSTFPFKSKRLTAEFVRLGRSIFFDCISKTPCTMVWYRGFVLRFCFSRSAFYSTLII